MVTFKKGRCGVRDEDAASGVETIDDVVGEQSLQLLLAWLWGVLWDLPKRLVGGCEDGVVGLRRIKGLDQVVVLVDELGKLGCVLALGDELVDGLMEGQQLSRTRVSAHSHLVGLAMLRWVSRTVMWRSMVWRAMMSIAVVRRMVLIKECREVLGLGFEPRLNTRGRIVDLPLSPLSAVGSALEGLLPDVV